MTRPALLLVLLAGSCATERDVQRAATGVASAAAIFGTVVQRIVPPTAPQLTPGEKLAAQLAPVAFMTALNVYHAVSEFLAARRAAAAAADMGVPVDAGAPP